MNSVLREAQKDSHIRFWDSENSLVKTRYFDSQFMYQANLENLYYWITSIEGHSKNKYEPTFNEWP